MHSCVKLLLISSFFGFTLMITSDDLKVTLTNGSKLVGRYFRLYSGRPIKAFMSIPYAEPPIGHLRFRKPLPKWDGEYKAMNDLPWCIQQNPFVRNYSTVGVEDCLYLNVYVPHTFGEKKSDIPVMLHLHGGGFTSLSSSMLLYGPEALLDHDVILVAPNYRLGSLGFLSTEDDTCPGNFGLKDQILVLKWIQENIKQFGGDPDCVTIFGGSTGAASVTYLMASPLAKGLFSKAIAQSGRSLAPWSQPAYEGVARKRAKQLAEECDCFVPNDWPQTIECLREIPAANITAASFSFFDFDTDPKTTFSPVIEPESPEAFITKHPRDSINENSIKIPFLTGVTFNEGLLKSMAILTISGLYGEFANKLDYALPIMFYYDHKDALVQESITEKIKTFYFDNQLSKDKLENITNLFDDGWHLYPTEEYTRLRLTHNKDATTFVYLFTHNGTARYIDSGVCHADEINLIFSRRERAFINTLPSIEDEYIREALTRMWVDFARTGNPTPDSSPLPKWEKANGFLLNYYRIGNLNFENKPLLEMENDGIFGDRIKFWRELGPFSAATHLEKDEL